MFSDLPILCLEVTKWCLHGTFTTYRNTCCLCMNSWCAVLRLVLRSRQVLVHVLVVPTELHCLPQEIPENVVIWDSCAAARASVPECNTDTSFSYDLQGLSELAKSSSACRDRFVVGILLFPCGSIRIQRGSIGPRSRPCLGTLAKARMAVEDTLVLPTVRAASARCHPNHTVSSPK